MDLRYVDSSLTRQNFVLAISYLIRGHRREIPNCDPDTFLVIRGEEIIGSGRNNEALCREYFSQGGLIIRPFRRDVSPAIFS